MGKLADEFGLCFVVLFGSRATGQTHPESDFDIAYSADRKVDFDEEIKINTRLTEILGNINVQLVNMKTAPPLLLKRITGQAVVLYESRPHLLDELYIYARRVYEEAQPLFELREHYVNHRIKNYHHA